MNIVKIIGINEEETTEITLNELKLMIRVHRKIYSRWQECENKFLDVISKISEDKKLSREERRDAGSLFNELRFLMKKNITRILHALCNVEGSLFHEVFIMSEEQYKEILDYKNRLDKE